MLYSLTYRTKTTCGSLDVYIIEVNLTKVFHVYSCFVDGQQNCYSARFTRIIGIIDFLFLRCDEACSSGMLLEHGKVYTRL